MKDAWRSVSLGAAAILAAGCGAAPEPVDARWADLAPAPYVVRIVLPALEDAGAPAAIPLDRARLESAIRAELEPLDVCTRLELSASPVRDEDLVITVESSGPPTYAFSHRTGWFLPNTALWLLLGFPSFWIPDRVYEVRWEVRFRVRSVAARSDLREIYSYSLSEDRALHLAERGWTAPVLYTPPGLYEGPNTPDVLVTAVERWLAQQLVAFIKGESRSFPFDVRIAIASPLNLETLDAGQAALRLRIESPTVLERIRIEVDGKTIWEKDPLTMVRATIAPDAPGGNGFHVYERVLPLDLPPGEHEVRVLARRMGETSLPGPTAEPPWSASKTVRFVGR